MPISNFFLSLFKAYVLFPRARGPGLPPVHRLVSWVLMFAGGLARASPVSRSAKSLKTKHLTAAVHWICGAQTTLQTFTLE